MREFNVYIACQYNCFVYSRKISTSDNDNSNYVSVQNKLRSVIWILLIDQMTMRRWKVYLTTQILYFQPSCIKFYSTTGTTIFHPLGKLLKTSCTFILWPGLRTSPKLKLTKNITILWILFIPHYTTSAPFRIFYEKDTLTMFSK